MNCREVQALIPFYDELPEEEKRKVQHHIRRCKTCYLEFKLERRLRRFFKRKDEVLLTVTSIVSMAMVILLIFLNILCSGIGHEKVPVVLLLPADIAGKAEAIYGTDLMEICDMLSFSPDTALKPLLFIEGGVYENH